MYDISTFAWDVTKSDYPFGYNCYRSGYKVCENESTQSSLPTVIYSGSINLLQL